MAAEFDRTGLPALARSAYANEEEDRKGARDTQGAEGEYSVQPMCSCRRCPVLAALCLKIPGPLRPLRSSLRPCGPLSCLILGTCSVVRPVNGYVTITALG